MRGRPMYALGSSSDPHNQVIDKVVEYAAFGIPHGRVIVVCLESVPSPVLQQIMHQSADHPLSRLRS